MLLYEVSVLLIVLSKISSLKSSDFKNVYKSEESRENSSYYGYIIEILFTSESIINEFVEPIIIFESGSTVIGLLKSEGI